MDDFNIRDLSFIQYFKNLLDITSMVLFNLNK